MSSLSLTGSSTFRWTDGLISRVSVSLGYDGATNTLRTGERPPEPPSSELPDTEKPPTPVEIDRMLAELAPTSELTQGTPVRYAGREAYVMTLRPKDEGSTLVDHGRALIDSETFLPLELALYAQGKPDPVFSWRVTSLDVGTVPAERFQFQTPPGARVIPFDESGEGRHKPEMRAEPEEVETVAEAQELVDFEIGELAQPPGGRKLTGVSTVISRCFITPMRSHNRSASARLCVQIKIVRPCDLTRSMNSRTRRAASGSSADVGSSRKTTEGSCSSARQIASFCFIPLENVPTASLRRAHKPRKRKYFSTCPGTSTTS